MKRPPRCVVIHGLDHARAAATAAAAAGAPVRLRSAPAAAAHGGPAWFREIVAAARAEFPHLAIEAALDCGDAPGHALAALRAGVERIRFHGPARVTAKIEALCAAHGAVLETGNAAALDLASETDPEAACRAWFAGGGRSKP